ncbi:MAG TPA: EscU/YscU/HrcU family type III secretion system export apparatus switch protein [Burkholderiales bacterium]|nr:EscU/YscU/HrcU family type III secretion system export apparatus switch protein [Burkholderiales bacterium]
MMPGDARRAAVALQYRNQDLAPRVVAKGRGELAERIIAAAREHGVYVHESRELVSLLMQVDLDQHIPPALYIAVAELLAWVYRLEHGWRPVAAASPLPPGDMPT